MSSQTIFWKKRSRNWRLRVHFFARDAVSLFLAVIFKGSLFLNFGRKCCQGKLCANCSKFSRQKSWYIYETFFLTPFWFNWKLLKINKMICWVCDLLSVYWRTIKVETETEYLTLLTCLLIVDDDTRRKRITKFSVYWQYIYLKKKKIGACVFWAPYFLAGKFTTFEQMLLTE